MIELDKILESLKQEFQNLTEIEKSLYRGEKVYGGKLYSIAYFDLRDDVIGLASDLRNFQDRLIGKEYFELPDDLRWSSYLYVLYGSEAINTEEFKEAKSLIEGNREYARKFVLTVDDFLSLISSSLLFSINKDIETIDVTTAWEDHLTAHQLNTLLDKPVRSKAIEQIEKGLASKKTVKPKEYVLNNKDTKLTKGFLRNLEIETFRPVHDGKNYSFANVNLIVGPNGSGKTSLLEAIEYLYCGHNRRNDAHENHKLIGKIEFATAEENGYESINSTNDASRLKARNFNWYRKENHQSKSIIDGFTKYNFLDTDAAFRLSTDLEPDALHDDLRRLLVGSDASTLWDYLEKLMIDLNDKIKDQNIHMILYTQRHDQLKKELERIAQAPSQATSLSKTFRAMLRKLNWKGPETSKTEVVSVDERSNIEAVASSLKHIRAILPSNDLTLTHIKGLLDDLKNLRNSAKLVESKRIKVTESLTIKTNGLNHALFNLDILREWSNYCLADAPRLLRTIKDEEQKIQSYKQQLGAMASSNVPTLLDQYDTLPLNQIGLIINDLVKNANYELHTAEIAQRNIESLNNSLSLLRRQLQEITRQIINKTGENKLCPICKTSHPPELLHSKIEALSGSEVQTDIAELASRIQAAKTRESDLARLKNDIAILNNMASFLKMNPSTHSAKDIRVEVDSLQRKLVDSLESMRKAKDSVKNFDLVGMSPERYSELKLLIKDIFKTEDDVENIELLNSAIKKLQVEVKSYSEDINNLNLEIEDISSKLKDLLDKTPLSFSKSFINVDEIFITLEEELLKITNINILFERINKLIALKDNQSILEIEIEITSVIEAFDHAWHAAEIEHLANLSNKNIKKEYEEVIENIKLKKENLTRLKSASSALKKLRSEYSLSSATDQVLALIGKQINDVFSRIHSPREYEFSSSSSSLLINRDENKVRTLEQVSTGQRAAFALSIFLALNSTARSAPPILLIDDPIAHIDDLNALSFMDYLRDLALNSRRQIFFATADTRVAALFEKKFSFLGQTIYKRIQLTHRKVV